MTGETLDGKSLGKVSRIRVSKNANLLLFSFPRSDATSAATFDFMGVTARIDIDGTVDGSSDVSTFISNFQGTNLTGGLITGSQDTAYALVTDNFSVSVKVDSISITEEGGKPDLITYSMSLVVSA